MARSAHAVLVLALAGLVLAAPPFGQLPHPAAAASPPKACDSYRVDRSEVRIRGLLGDPESFTGVFRVSTSAENQKPSFSPAGDLTGTSAQTISESRIEVTNPAEALPKDQPRAVRVTVKGVRFAGTYHGKLQLEGGSCELPLTLVATAGPDLALIGGSDAKITLDLIGCRRLTCGPGDFLEPLVSEDSRRNQVSPRVDNGSQSPAQITAVQVVLERGPGGEAVSSAAVTPTQTRFVLEQQTVSRLPPLLLKRDEIGPGHYTGKLYLTVAGAEERTAFPLDIDLKDGPFWAVMLLLTALLLRAAVWAVDRNRPKKAALRDLHRLRKAQERTLAYDARRLTPRLDQVRDLIVAGEIDQAKENLAAIKKDGQILADALALVQEARRANKDLPPEAIQALDALRKAVEEGKTGEANAQLTDLRNHVRNLIRPPRHKLDLLVERFRTGAADVVTAQDGGRQASKRGAGTRAAAAWLQQRLRAASHLIARLARSAGRTLKYWFVLATIHPLPWLLRGVFVVLFLLIGLDQLYVDKSTFGDDTVFDYGLLLATGAGAAGLNELGAKLFRS